MTITLQIVCDGIPCGPPLSASAARAWLEFVQHVPAETAKAMMTAMRERQTRNMVLARLNALPKQDDEIHGEA